MCAAGGEEWPRFLGTTDTPSVAPLRCSAPRCRPAAPPPLPAQAPVEAKSGGGFPRALLAAVVVAAAAGAVAVLGGGAKGAAPSAAGPAKPAKSSWRK